MAYLHTRIRALLFGRIFLGLLVAIGMLLVAAPIPAQESDDPTEGSDDKGPDLGAIARALDNPVGNLWVLFTENAVMRYRGDPADGSKWVNAVTIQPILPIPLTEKWNLVNRPIIPLLTAPRFNVSPRFFGDCPPNCNTKPPPDDLGLFDLNEDRKTRWGDIMFWSMLTPADPIELDSGAKFVWGAGQLSASRPRPRTSSALNAIR